MTKPDKVVLALRSKKRQNLREVIFLTFVHRLNLLMYSLLMNEILKWSEDLKDLDSEMLVDFGDPKDSGAASSL